MYKKVTNRWPGGTYRGGGTNVTRRLLSMEWFMGLVLIIILVLLLIGALPTWPYSGGWGYYPSGGLGTILVVVLILMLLGRL